MSKLTEIRERWAPCPTPTRCRDDCLCDHCEKREDEEDIAWLIAEVERLREYEPQPVIHDLDAHLVDWRNKLARLEAAERVCELLDGAPEDDVLEVEKAALKAWRATKGGE